MMIPRCKICDKPEFGLDDEFYCLNDERCQRGRKRIEELENRIHTLECNFHEMKERGFDVMNEYVKNHQVDDKLMEQLWDSLKLRYYRIDTLGKFDRREWFRNWVVIHAGEVFAEKPITMNSSEKLIDKLTVLKQSLRDLEEFEGINDLDIFYTMTPEEVVKLNKEEQENNENIL